MFVKINLQFVSHPSSQTPQVKNGCPRWSAETQNTTVSSSKTTL